MLKYEVSITNHMYNGGCNIYYRLVPAHVWYSKIAIWSSIKSIMFQNQLTKHAQPKAREATVRQIPKNVKVCYVGRGIETKTLHTNAIADGCISTARFPWN